MAEPKPKPTPAAIAPEERRAWLELVRGQRRVLNGHRDSNATEREAGAIQIASANRKLAALGVSTL